MRVRLTDEARRQARLVRAWWRSHRDERLAFDEDLVAARDRLKTGPKHKVYGFIDGEPIRRMLLERTGYHLYYVIYESNDLVRIVAIWGATLGAGPDLG